MRICVKDLAAVVGVAPAGSNRPVRLRIGGNTYAMTTGEAVDLATQLADIVQHLKQLDRTPA